MEAPNSNNLQEMIKNEPDFVVVKDPTEGSEEIVELPTNPINNHLTLRTLEHTFPNSCGEEFLPPADGWKDKIFTVVLRPKVEGESEDSLKRKRVRNNSEGTEVVKNDANGENGADNDETDIKKMKVLDKALCSDLIVLGLPYKMTEEDLREYFLEFGDVVLCEVKIDPNGKSRGFGFVKMADYEAQGIEAMSPNLNINPKLFVGRLQEKTTKEELTEYFLKHAHRIDKKSSVLDVYVPKPFRGFAFITFSSPTVAKELIRQGDFIIDGYSISVSAAAPKIDQKFETKQPFNYRNSSNPRRPLMNTPAEPGMYRERYYEGGNRNNYEPPPRSLMKRDLYDEPPRHFMKHDEVHDGPIQRYPPYNPPNSQHSVPPAYAPREEGNHLQQAAMTNLNQEVVNAALKAFWSVAGPSGSQSGPTPQHPPPQSDGLNRDVWR